MLKNRVFAAIYRLFAAAVTIVGLLLGSGLSGGPARLLSYTGQSNILCVIYLLYAAGRGILDIVKNGAKGSACYSPRFFSGILITILFTMIIFWGILAPHAHGQNLLSTGNLILHTFSPLLMLLDYVLFCQKCALKKKDVALFTLFPLIYVAESLILGFSGFVFYTKNGVQYFFPYLFMDFNQIGGLAAICIAIVSAAFVGASFLLIFFNNKKFSKRLRFLRGEDKT